MQRVIAFIIAGLLIFTSSIEAREISKAEFIKDINVLFLKESYSALVRDAENNLGRHRFRRKEKREILYLVALSYIKLGNFSKARSVFNDILKMKGKEFREDAYIGIADSYFEEENFNKAIKVYKDALKMYPRSDRLSSVYYNLGISYKAKEDFAKANLYFQKVKGQYNSSFEADKVAYLPIKRKPDYYIIQLGAFKSLRNAKKLVKRLRRKKYDSYIQKVKTGGRVLYRVRGGKFSNKYYAMRLLRKLRRDRFSAKIIVE